MLPIDLSGKTCVITGATGELGRVMARTLATAGANIGVNYFRAEDKAAALVGELQGMGVQALAVQADVTDRDAIFAMRDKLLEGLGPVDIIVNNAVIQFDWVSVLEQGEEDYESQFRSCVLHNVMMAKAFVPAMIDRAWGRVIGINTECAMQCTPSQSAYASGKRGMDGVLRVLAREVGKHNITVNQVAPGWTISENRGPVDGDKGYREKVPLARRGYDQEIANTVAFLASDLASFITGAYVPVCGGNVMPTI